MSEESTPDLLDPEGSGYVPEPPWDVDYVRDARLLVEAKNAHTAYEAEHGPDEDWPTWYAEYILGLR